jgi:hypothetical protein
VSDRIITIGESLGSPLINGEKAGEIYNLVRSPDFIVADYNALLFAVVTYGDLHGIDIDDLPWAEEMEAA